MLKKITQNLRKSIFNTYHLDKMVSDQLRIIQIQNSAENSTNNGTTTDLLFENPLIVSLTTYGNRIYDVHLTIESLLNQTIRPNKIILWLDHSFENFDLPMLLQKQIQRGLEIHYCSDIKSYTKLVPTLEAYPLSIIISVDDDMVYSSDFIEVLVNAFKKDKSKIYFNRGHQICLSENNDLKPYKDWVKKGASGSTIFNFPTGVGGVLYPPNCLHEDVTNRKLFLSLCPNADDVWFKAMSLLKKVECVNVDIGKTTDKRFVYIDTAVSYSLSNTNNLQGMNDVQIKNVFEKYHLINLLTDNNSQGK